MRKVALLLMSLVSILGMSSVVASAQTGNATVTIVHALPKFTADVYVDGKLALDGFKPETTTQPLQIPAGGHHVAIREVGAAPTSKPALAGTVRLDAATNYSLVAHYDAKGQPELSVYRNDLSPVPAGRCRVVVRNAATPPPVSLSVKGQADDAVFADLSSGQDDQKIVPPGKYTVRVLSASQSRGMVAPQTLNVNEGTSYLLYVIGSSPQGTLNLMVQPLRVRSAPKGVPTGNGGFAAPSGMPAWAGALGAVTAILLVGSGFMLARRPRRWTAG
jgi:Domain of unknown function (DUF4397)